MREISLPSSLLSNSFRTGISAPSWCCCCCLRCCCCCCSFTDSFLFRRGGRDGDKRGEAWTGKRKRDKGWRGGLGVAADVFRSVARRHSFGFVRSELPPDSLFTVSVSFYITSSYRLWLIVYECIVFHQSVGKLWQLSGRAPPRGAVFLIICKACLSPLPLLPGVCRRQEGIVASLIKQIKEF